MKEVRWDGSFCGVTRLSGRRLVQNVPGCVQNPQVGGNVEGRTGRAAEFSRIGSRWPGLVPKHGPRQAHAGLFRPSSRFPLPYPALVSANQKSGPSLQVPSSATPGSPLKFTRAGFPSRLLHEFHYRRLREPSRRSFHLSQQQSSSQIPHQIGPQIQSSPWLAATQYRLPGSHRALGRDGMCRGNGGAPRDWISDWTQPT
jgi:hypothetical protein